MICKKKSTTKCILDETTAYVSMEPMRAASTSARLSSAMCCSCAGRVPSGTHAVVDGDGARLGRRDLRVRRDYQRDDGALIGSRAEAGCHIAEAVVGGKTCSGLADPPCSRSAQFLTTSTEHLA